jgi:uncharacterized protein YbjT (DUF2867 family)
MKTALIAGSTGLIGNHLLRLLLDAKEYHVVKAITRRDPGIKHQKLQIITADFKSLIDSEPHLKADDVFCCIGTTMKAAGSKDAFEEIDLKYPSLLATLSSAHGARHFGLVSALGADKSSSFYYNQVKARAEEAIGNIPFPSIHIYRPSLLLGDRSEIRPAEEAAKVVYKVLNFMIPAKYKGIEAAAVANAMFHFAQREDTGTHIHASAELQQFNTRV